jgi:hypothetical protein
MQTHKDGGITVHINCDARKQLQQCLYGWACYESLLGITGAECEESSIDEQARIQQQRSYD